MNFLLDRRGLFPGWKLYQNVDVANFLKAVLFVFFPLLSPSLSQGGFFRN